MEPILLKLVELTAAAVIQYLVDKTDLVDHVRGWLKRDPASLAYQRALLRAYAAFARSDPALAKSFFDETFLAGAAVPELAKQLTRHQHANSAELARLWAASLFSDALAEKRAAYATDARVVHACANFLQWLENELKREQVFQPLFDSRALDALEAKFDDLVRVLMTQRDEAMQRAQAYQLVVEHTTQSGGVNIAGGAHVHAQDIFSGDKYVIENYHAYFSGGFTTLDDYYIAPDSVFERVKVAEFVGREWLTGKLDQFLDGASRPSGVFRLEGEAGVGKTSFLAHLVRERGYLHLFAEQVPGDNNVERALLSLGAQIVSRYRLDPYADRNTLPAIAGGTDFLYKLLNLASQRLTDGEKIVVVCDALDEAGNGTNGNVFGLPTTLPENVFFVLSQRPVSVRLEIKCDIHQERLKPDAAENLQDMHDYLRGMARRPAVAQQLKARNYSEAEFVSVLSEKSGGVWMYLQYVLDEIQRGWRHPLELENLPNGLVGYYLAYWGDWRAGRNQRGKGESEWYALYLPLLTTLAAAQEPIPLDTLIAWAGVNESQYRVRNLLREQWRAFITEREEKDTPLRYILYHASLRDFLTGKVKMDALATADGNFIDELREGTRAAHQRIVKNFAERCRGEWTDLIPDEYARRYLTLHLDGAEQYDILRELVAWSDAWAKARYDKEESWSGYLTDLERVWAFAEQKENIGWQIRCALIESTIHSLAANISPEFLVQLVETNLWSPARALAHIPQMPEDSKKAEALGKLAPLLPRELLGDALTAARAIQDESYRANALSGLAAHLSAEEKVQVVNEALTAARAIQDESWRAFALRDLAAHLSAEEKVQVVNEALTAARAIQDESWRANALSGLAAHLSAEEKVQVVNDALTAARAIQDEPARAEALSGLAAHLPAEQLNEALTAARAIQGESARAFALSRLAAHLSAEEK
ncbi:MAG: ATP-binding protein, partial [Chloroflexota bacterium]